MNGSGCKNCPAYAKCTASYRGSQCAALRHSYGIDTDPMTNADRIRAMSDKELAEKARGNCNWCPDTDWECMKIKGAENACYECWLKWLQQPVEEES